MDRVLDEIHEFIVNMELLIEHTCSSMYLFERCAGKEHRLFESEAYLWLTCIHNLPCNDEQGQLCHRNRQECYSLSDLNIS